MDQNKLNELKELAQKATQGNWFIIAAGKNSYAIGAETKPCETLVISSYYDPNEMRVYGLPDKLNAAYIAAANPSVVLALIEKIETLEKEADWLAEQLSDLIDHASIHVWREAARKAVEEQWKRN